MFHFHTRRSYSVAVSTSDSDQSECSGNPGSIPVSGCLEPMRGGLGTIFDTCRYNTKTSLQPPDTPIFLQSGDYTLLRRAAKGVIDIVLVMDFPEGRHPKRRRLDNGLPLQINSVEDLQNLLAFRQTSSPEVKTGIQALKDFLGTVPKNENVAEQATKLRLLKQYCDAQSPEDENGIAFPDLISAWSYASENNNDPIISAVPAVLAQFLRIISSYLEFREFGLALCRTLLQKEQVRLFERGLSAARSKEHLISPCIRLLTEVVTFDGGALAGTLYARKDALYKRLDILLQQTATPEEILDRRKPTLRRIAQRFVIANLKLQSTSIKGDLIGQGKILHALLKGIDRDGDDIVVDILQVIQSSILNDSSLHRKSRLLSTSNLASLLALYDYREAPPTLSEQENEEYFEGKLRQDVRSQIHAFFLSASQPGKGLMLPQTGWYPQGADPDFYEPVSAESRVIDLGLDSPLYFDEYQDKIPVKNDTLSTFVQNLRPETDDLQAALFLQIFEFAPELVADYFSKTKRFNSKPSDDAAWRAQSALLFSIVQLPVPQNCGWQEELPELPPPTSIIVESILPRALDRNELTRCLNLAHELVTLFAAKYITTSLQKLSKVLDIFKSASKNPSVWNEAAEKLTNTFIARSPSTKDIIAALQRSSKNDENLRTALLECLAAYFQLLPQFALAEKFDVAIVLGDILQKFDAQVVNKDDREMYLNQLLNLVIIAARSVDVRWWHKSKALVLCPFVALVKAVAEIEPTVPARRRALALLRIVMTEKAILQSSPRAFDAFMTSLMSAKRWSPSQTVYVFVDNCLSYHIRQPVKYLEQLEAAQAYNSDQGPLSLLTCCIAEQWPFFAKSGDDDGMKEVATWIARLFNALEVAGENFRVLTQLQKEMVEKSPEKAKSVLQKAFEKQEKKQFTLINTLIETKPASINRQKAPGEDKLPPTVELNAIFTQPSQPLTTLSGLDKWPTATLDTEIQSPRLTRLIRGTASPLSEIRLQTFTTLQSLLPTLAASANPESQRIHLLLGELLETIKSSPHHHPLPNLIPTMTALLLRILADPADKMYSKANRFLLRAPRWEVAKLPSYWITQVLLREPGDDNSDGHHLEVDRLLAMLVDGLQTEGDMELYRRNGVFERVLGLWGSPHTVEGARRRVLELVWRGCQAGETGMMTLITRVGIGSWIDIALLRVKGEEGRGILEALKAEVKRVLDGEEGRRWIEGRNVGGKKGRKADVDMKDLKVGR